MEMRGLSVQLLGRVRVMRDGEVVPLPRSRKVRVLLAYLALSPEPVARTRLCDLLWDVPDDPRGELRWCLSKLRTVLDDGERRRVIATDQHVALDLSDCRVDAISPSTAELCDHAEELLDGDDLDGHPELAAWLAGQRDRFRTLRIAAAKELGRVDRWLQLAPLDPEPHAHLIGRLVRDGRRPDAERHLAATIRTFETEGLDWSPLRDACRIEPGAQASREPRGVRVPSVAVMPFTGDRAAAGFTEDIIMQLAKLRALFVTARGSVFALADRGLAPREAGALLGVDYVVTGRVGTGERTAVTVELADVAGGHIVWTDELVAADPFAALRAVAHRIVAGVAEEIELVESRRALLKDPSSLDAWEAYHRGLWHMYKFTGPDNGDAARFFRAAIDLDPTFARAHAGLSFTHFQNAFLALVDDGERDREIARAFDTAAHSVAADDRDPAAHWAMGRALWLRDSTPEAIAELERSIDLSPSFALGHYTLGFVHSQTGDPRAAIAATDYSRALSPFDPLLFGMLSNRAVAHLRLDEPAEASEWALRACARPNAHAHILAIASVCLSLANRRDEARRVVGRVRAQLPAYTVETLLRAFRFGADDSRRIRLAARVVEL